MRPCFAISPVEGGVLRLLHTGDWHLGRLFHGISLVEDQAHLLDQLARIVEEAAIDAVLIAGDVYDRAVPPPEAVSLFDAFVARVAGDAGVPVVVIAGNHDSPDRLSFGARLLATGGLHVRGRPEPDPRPIVLSDASGPVEFVALPYLDPPHARAVYAGSASAARRCGEAINASGDATRTQEGAPTGGEAEHALRDHDACVAEGLARAAVHARRGRRRVCLAHAFVRGATESESERPLLVGGGGMVSARRFLDFDYSALGHLHRPQTVAAEHVRYAGSLMPYSFSESTYAKSVSLVEMNARGGVSVEAVRLTPRRAVRIVEGRLDELLAETPEDVAREDYLLARLSDRGALHHPMARLRERYPNVLQIERPALEVEGRFTPGTAAAALARKGAAPRSPRALFEDFFAAVMERPLDEELGAVLGEVEGAAEGLSS